MINYNDSAIEEKSAGCVIFRNTLGKRLYLLLNYPLGHWDFVKGKIEKDENYHQTVIREAKEETGIDDLKFIDGFEETIEYNFQFNGKLVQKSVVFFLAKTEQEQITLSHEHLDYIWLCYNDALEKTTYENAKKILKKAEESLGKTL